MAQKMTRDQWHAFLSEGTRTGKLATVRADGSPHLAPVWFLMDGDELVLVRGANVPGQDPPPVLAYDPEVDRWRELSGRLPSQAAGVDMSWTGREILAWLGSSPFSS